MSNNKRFRTLKPSATPDGSETTAPSMQALARLVGEATKIFATRIFSPGPITEVAVLFNGNKTTLDVVDDAENKKLPPEEATSGLFDKAASNVAFVKTLPSTSAVILIPRGTKLS